VSGAPAPDEVSGKASRRGRRLRPGPPSTRRTPPRA